jgi:tetratricopeptide (TPR) repeat protein
LPQQLTLRLTSLADKYPQFLPVYLLAVQSLLHSGGSDQAMTLARRATDLLPNSAPAAKMLTNVYGFMARWTDMNQAAQLWRQRSLDNPIEPDIALAVSYLANGHAADALTTLQPYVKSGTADPSNVELTTTYARALIGAAREDDADAFLRPLAQNSAEWRSIWLRLAVPTHADAAGASAWVKRVLPLIPANSVAEQCGLADTWYGIGAWYNNPDAFAKAQAILNPLAGRSDLPPDTLMTLASSMDLDGDKAQAEVMYRRVLLGNPHMAPAQNNLAYLLLMKNDPAVLGEAETLAKAAVASAPQDSQTSPYYDTLARVYLKESQTAPAEAAFAQAATLQPWNVDVLIGLGDARIKLNKLDKASESLAQIDALVRNRTVTLSADQQKQVEDLRDQCKGVNRNPVSGTN